MGDAGDRLPEGGHFLRLEQLLVEVARLIVEPLSLADITDERLDVQARAGLRARSAAFPRAAGDLDPDRRAVDAPQTEQVVGDDAVGRQAIEERTARGGIGEAGHSKRRNVRLDGVSGVAEHSLEMRVRRDGRPVVVRVERGKGADEDALVQRLEQARERGGARVAGQEILADLTGPARRFRP